ncbi:MAG: hypothetical protein ABS92_09085 [Thiobacillus sp. SCN 63-374]|nr:MAG: hypothetical protein ABS92_09085 [Thiobacillus sp. SCN 63-374]
MSIGYARSIGTSKTAVAVVGKSASDSRVAEESVRWLRRWTGFLAYIVLALAPHLADASNFVTAKLPRGVEMALPKGWVLLGSEHEQLIRTTTEAAFDLSGVTPPEGADATLLSANSLPRSTYASVRVVSTTPAPEAPAVIARLTQAELLEVEAETRAVMQRLAATQGNRLLSFKGVTRSSVSGHPTLTTDYRRSGPNGPVVVSVIQIFTPAQVIRINLAYRESEQALWKPVIGKIRNSIVVNRWP